jgi:L-threonylcarbamoyladenylate synthase
MMEVTVKELLEKNLKGKIIVFQTDTVYGLGCLLNDELAIEKIYAIKKREKKKPLAVLVGDMKSANALLKYPKRLKPYAERFWPGALTIVSEKSDEVSDIVSRGMSTVGIRMPDDALAKSLLEHFGPMIVTSLNLSSEHSILMYKDALAFEDSVDYIVKGNDLEGIASTVLNIDTNKVLRNGAVKI